MERPDRLRSPPLNTNARECAETCDRGVRKVAPFDEQNENTAVPGGGAAAEAVEKRSD